MRSRAIFFAAAVFIAFGAGCSLRKSDAPVNVNAPNETIPTLSAPPQNATTTRYESVQFGYSFSYPVDFHIEELPVEGALAEKNVAQFLVLMPEAVWADEAVKERTNGPKSVRIYVVPKIGKPTLEDAVALMSGVSRDELEKMGYTTLYRENGIMVRYVTQGSYHTEHLVMEHGDNIFEIAADGNVASDPTAKAFDVIGKSWKFE